MSSYLGPNIVNDGLILSLDVANIKSFRGIPTTNTMRQVNDASGDSYGPGGEYSASILSKIYNSNLKTPIGNGATLCTQQSISGYYHCLNWIYSNDESGKECLSAYIYPQNTGITNFYIGMVADPNNGVFFNLDTLAITYGGGISNRNAFITTVTDYPGWYRVGANIEGRPGGWVASIGIGQYEIYTPTTPFKSFYICGMQYEINQHYYCTPFVAGSRGTTFATGGGLIDLSGNENHGELVNGPIYDSDNMGSLIYDGVDDYVTVPALTPARNTPYYTIEMWIKSTIGDRSCVFFYSGYIYFYLYNLSSGDHNLYFVNRETDTYLWRSTQYTFTNHNTITQVVGVRNNDTLYLYENGIYKSEMTVTGMGVNNDACEIGGTSWTTNDFPGNISIVKIYNRALSGAEILQNYKAQKSRYGL